MILIHLLANLLINLPPRPCNAFLFCDLFCGLLFNGGGEGGAGAGEDGGGGGEGGSEHSICVDLHALLGILIT